VGLILREREPEGSKGVTLGQLAALTERATQALGQYGIAAEEARVKARVNFGGTIKQIEIEIG
jgi:hypothetical protein